MTKPLRTINFGGEDTYHLAPEWNNVDGKPFGEETVYGDTLIWDGNTEGLTGVGGAFYHVSDNTPTFTNGTGEIFIEGTKITFSFDESVIAQIGTGIYTIMVDQLPPPCVVVTNEGVGVDCDGLSFPKEGLYFHNESGLVYTSSLTINGYNGFETKVVKQLDNKYLEPFETVGGDTLTWDGNTEGLESASEAPLYRISNVVPTREDFVNGLSVGYAGGEIQLSGEDAQTGFMEDGLGVFDFVFIIPTDNYTAEGCGVFPKAGIYALNDGSAYVSSFTINGYTGFTATKLKKEYIPVDYIKQLIAEVTGK